MIQLKKSFHILIICAQNIGIMLKVTLHYMNILRNFVLSQMISVQISIVCASNMIQKVFYTILNVMKKWSKGKLNKPVQILEKHYKQVYVQVKKQILELLPVQRFRQEVHR
ncbi:hypothetical protein PVMG_06081 [Plasmodium vivax Mauritania I]|uniref:Uncharacterized protein n=1 Tax=Plasmodium vivax Mauritania I TaxID=1035515 RepID=A0A0J9VWE1_PLAVI|nr:hypothetical protein PVMG_06081 [Plasmodium vivax Mauritania I]